MTLVCFLVAGCEAVGRLIRRVHAAWFGPADTLVDSFAAEQLAVRCRFDLAVVQTGRRKQAIAPSVLVECLAWKAAKKSRKGKTKATVIGGGDEDGN